VQSRTKSGTKARPGGEFCLSSGTGADRTKSGVLKDAVAETASSSAEISTVCRSCKMTTGTVIGQLSAFSGEVKQISPVAGRPVSSE